MIPEALLKAVAEQKLNEFKQGIVPEGWHVVEKTDTTIVLKADKDSFLGGLEINSFNIDITHQGININIII